MVGISIRLDDHLKERLDSFAEQQNVSSSDVVRDALDEKLKVSDRKNQTSELPSKTERLIMWNQYEILEKLDPSSSKEYQRKKRILERGYSLDYGWDASFIEPEHSIEICREVIRILDMQSMICYSFRELENKEYLTERDVCFSGFDGNYETDLMGYATFKIFEDQKFEILKEFSGFSLNSHFPMIETYRKRLDRWASTGEQRQMQNETIRFIIDKPEGH